MYTSTHELQVVCAIENFVNGGTYGVVENKNINVFRFRNGEAVLRIKLGGFKTRFRRNANNLFINSSPLKVNFFKRFFNRMKSKIDYV